MVELKSIDITTQPYVVTYKDGKTITYPEFKNKFNAWLTGRVAGETVTVADMERFLKRGSSKNIKQLIDVTKAEGTLEALIGKKLDPRLMKMILIIALVAVIGIIAAIVMQKMGLI